MQNTTRISLGMICLTLALVGGPACAQEQSPASAEQGKPEDAVSRPYRDGPLTAADFAGTRPADARTSAWTEFDYKWNYGYRHERQGKQFVVTLREIEVWAVIRRDKSWNSRLRDPLLMDHEQGHFDLAQTGALEAQQKLQAELKGPNVLVAKAPTLSEAIKKLESRIATQVKPFIDAANQANVDYDAATNSGRNAQAQGVARQAQRERLQALITDIEKLAKE